jgi:transcriptional regulator with XRE-family HTH domain
MKAEHSFSLEGAGDSQVDGPSRFARALKLARFARGWTQAELAAQLALPKRAITSWETAERLPSVGMVVLLLDVLAGEEELSLNRELLSAYVVDDLERQARRRDGESPFSRRVQHVMGRMLQLPAKSGPQVVEEKGGGTVEETRKPRAQEGELEPLFALMSQFHQHPELIPVARDFLRELTSGE